MGPSFILAGYEILPPSQQRTKARERVGMAGHSCDRCNGGFLGLGRREPRGVFTIGGELNRKKEATKPEWGVRQISEK